MCMLPMCILFVTIVILLKERLHSEFTHKMRHLDIEHCDLSSTYLIVDRLRKQQKLHLRHTLIASVLLQPVRCRSLIEGGKLKACTGGGASTDFLSLNWLEFLYHTLISCPKLVCVRTKILKPVVSNERVGKRRSEYPSYLF
uniref:Putative secreted protein n=1 Tax=Ixodes scapularis TaxID=6945 RepID=A0A4D5RG44_IXOSC